MLQPDVRYGSLADKERAMSALPPTTDVGRHIPVGIWLYWRQGGFRK